MSSIKSENIDLRKSEDFITGEGGVDEAFDKICSVLKAVFKGEGKNQLQADDRRELYLSGLVTDKDGAPWTFVISTGWRPDTLGSRQLDIN